MKVRKEIVIDVLKEGFPTISVCMICHGVTGAYSGQNRPEVSKEEAFMLALIQHGTYLEKWGTGNVANRSFFPELCVCKCQHSFRDTHKPSTPRSGEHRAKCTKCGEIVHYDTSD